MTPGPTGQEREGERRNRARRCSAAAYTGDERFLGEARGIEVERGPRHTCLYPWLVGGWLELLASKLVSGGGGRDLPERKKATARGDSRGSNASSRHQWTSNDASEGLVELELLLNGVEGLQGSPTSSGRGGGQRPARPGCSYLRHCGGCRSGW